MAKPDKQNDVGGKETFGRYRLRGVLGQGGMGRLYVAEQTGIEGFSKIVALKQILPHLADSPQFRQMFLNEARIAARLEHPNIVVTYEFGEVEGVYFMAMEFLLGEDLAAILARSREIGPVPIQIAAMVAHQALSGLHYAHEIRDSNGKPAGLVHRDVNPSNILITYHGTVKLLDFGVVKNPTTAGTSPGTFKGKYGYCAPEQIRGEPVDPRTDVFCVGIVLWECLTGQRLFKGNSDAAAIDAVRSQTIVPPSTIRPEVPKELDEITMRALSRNREKRFTNAHEMAEAIDRFLASKPQRPTSKTVSQWLEGVFGVERARLKRALVQGSDIEGTLAQLANLSALHGSEEPRHTASGNLSRSRPNLQPRALWSTGVRKLPTEPRASSSAGSGTGTAHRGTERVPARTPERTFVEYGSEFAPHFEDEVEELSSSALGSAAGSGIARPGMPGDRTSRFSVPQELAEAAGLPSVPSAPLAPSPPAPSAATEEPSNTIPDPQPPFSAPRAASSGWGTKLAAGVGVLVGLGVIAVVVRTLGDAQEAAPAITAAAKSADLELKSEPPGAHILIDGEPTGLTTPTVLRNLRSGRSFEIRLDKPGYQTVIQKVEVGAGAPSARSFGLVPAVALLLFEGLPQGAAVYIDEVLVDAKGTVAAQLGPRKVRVENQGEVIFEKIIDARAGEHSIKVGDPGRSE
ncbi:MAG TPA: serine/threonine-protein kinase [Polyangia bacterium]